MRTLYRTHFELFQNGDKSLKFEPLRDEIINWARTRKNVTEAPPSETLISDFSKSNVGDGCFFESRAYQGDRGQAWGLRTTMPDEEPEISWVTETTLFRTPEDAIWFSCTLAVGRQGDTLSPVFRPANAPGIVRTVLAKTPGRGVLPLGAAPIRCSHEDRDVELFLQLLESKDRKHPVVFVASDRYGKTLVDPKKLATLLAGLSYVIVAADDKVPRKLSDHLADSHNCYNSGVRLYWPGFTRKCHPLDHPLWTRPKILQLNDRNPASLGVTILNRIASVSAFVTSPTLVSWQRLLELQRAEAIRRAKDNNQQGEMLELFEAENTDLHAQIAQLQMEIAERAKDVNRFRTQAENYRTALEAGEGNAAEQTLVENIQSVSDALDVISREHPDRLVFAWNSKSETDTSPYEDAPSVLKALRWLATTYHGARSGGNEQSTDLRHSIRESVEGWTFEPHQNKGTMKHPKLKEWYHTTHGGKSFSLPSHLRCGSTKDARHCIRIAFNWDTDSQKVILGYLGQHQENSAS